MELNYTNSQFLYRTFENIIHLLNRNGKPERCQINFQLPAFSDNLFNFMYHERKILCVMEERKMSDINRRSFVRQTGGTVAGLATLSAWGSQTVLGANERVNVGTIGIRSQGNSVTRSFLNTGKARVVALCDVDQKILNDRAVGISKEQNQKPETYSDYRELLSRSDIDAVIIATPDHWHTHQALQALEAGKDVYVEKPCAHNVNECRLIAKKAAETGRIVQHGTQQRSGKHFQEAREYVRSGKLGKIALARTWGVLGRDSIGKKPVVEPPAHLDYDAWQGPAPSKPYTENRSHYNWRFMWDYGTGDMGNWGVHWIDIALWTLDLTWPRSIASSGGMYVFDDDKETPDTQLTTYDYEDLTLFWELRMWSKKGIEERGVGTAFYGDQQTLVVDRGGWQAFSADGKEVVASGKPTNNMGVAHAEDFIESIKSRKPPIADISHGHISAAVAIFGNVAFLSDQKVRYNPEENTLQRERLNRFLTREYRDGWELPMA
jgi:predicted dehydrogenase